MGWYRQGQQCSRFGQVQSELHVKSYCKNLWLQPPQNFLSLSDGTILWLNFKSESPQEALRIGQVKSLGEMQPAMTFSQSNVSH